ncbi:MAG TPA: hypothetical protein ENG66_00740 [Thermococcus sp.]|nr:hypothetical protein [Thermococcus sp.]
MLQMSVEDCIYFIAVDNQQLQGKSPLECLYFIEKKFFKPKVFPKFKEEVQVWAELWFKKWKQRVKITSNPPPTKKRISPTKIKENIINQLIPTTIKQGELCGVKMISNLAVRLELTKTQQNLSDFQLLKRSEERVKELSRTTGPLIYIKLSKSFASQQKF